MKRKVSVIGTIFMDCKGFAAGKYDPSGRNLGSIQFVHGGVGRNVAENLALMGEPVSLVSAIDRSALGQEIIQRLQQSGVHTDYLAYVDEGGIGMWLAILLNSGDLAGSISQMPDLTHLEKLLQNHGEEIVSGSSHIVLEIDLNLAIAERIVDLAKRYAKPVFGLPGNLEVVMQKPELLSDLHCFICNHIEAEQLLKQPLAHLEPEQIITHLQRYAEEQQIRSMVITLGERGSVYCDSANGESGFQPVFPVKIADTTGAGDSFFAGTVMALANGLPLSKAVVCGTKVAGWTIQSTESICPDLPERMKKDKEFEAMFSSV